MSDFGDIEDILEDFLVEGMELLDVMDNELVELEKDPGNSNLLNQIFRKFHTIKGGAGFISATEMVNLCHTTENLFDQLRTGRLVVTQDMMDTILDATAAVRQMFESLQSRIMPAPPDQNLVARLKAALQE